MTWYQKFKESVFFRELFFLAFVTSLILFRTLLNRQLWMNPLSLSLIHILKECDVLLCPSQWQEPFGRVVLDAYKHAMPVICSDQGALPSLVDLSLIHI